jgi:uroporphyrinogen decarboxylase
MSYSHRERILAAVHHEVTDRVPTDFWGTDEVLNKLYRYFGCNNKFEMYNVLGIDGILNTSPPYVGPALPEEYDGDFWYKNQIWGMRFKAQSYDGGFYWEQVYYPLAEAETIKDLEDFPWPNPDWFDYDALTKQCELSAESERAIEVGYTAVFWYHNMLRGLETSLMDPMLKPEFTTYLLQRISNFFNEYHHRCFEAAGDFIDITQVTDDWGAQNGLLTSPQVFKEFYRAHIQSAIDLAKSFNIAVFHHDDGDMRPLLPTLTEMGIDILNPLQWRCGDWDLAALKAEFGDRICFHGGVDNQQTLPFGTPDEVRGEVKCLIETLASNQTGYILAPCHNIQTNTPVENILAMYEAAHEFGSFD